MLDPAVLASIADLELVARAVVDGTISGLHRSPFHGYSAEFSQYRHYQPGDDLKYVDWKLFARTDRVFTKQYRETTNLPAQIAIDASASMGFRGGNGVTKFEYARVLSAALAHLIAAQGDAVGLAVFDSGLRAHVPSRVGQPHFRRVLATLGAVTPSGTTATAAALRRVADLQTRRGLLIVVSDLYDDGDDVAGELRRAVRAGHEAAVFHVLTREEIQLPYGGDVELEDLETGSRMLTSAAAVAPAYKEAVEAFVERWRTRCASYGIDYTQATTDAPPDQVLRTYLLKRRGGAAR